MVPLAILEGGALSAGLAMGAASILSVGPNNITLIREGFAGGRVGLVATTVWASKVTLLTVALVLTDRIAERGQIVRPTLSWLGLVTLCWFAYSSLRAYLRASRRLQISTTRHESSKECIFRVFAIVWCNPLFYVETLFIPATIGSSLIMPACRILFISGLIMMATGSCYGYAFCGRMCAAFIRQRNLLRVFDLCSGLILALMALLMATALIVRPS